MSNLKSTYNFVPAPIENEVFIPDWSDKASHDIPFSDGESGEIELKITAQTPIFIRNGYSKPKPKEIVTSEFSHYFDANGKKQYFIPGTSLKGMFRNVLEIMSFSRLNPNLVNDDRYSFRDLTRDSEYMKSYDTNKVKAGWLKEDKEGNWSITECPFYHIHHDEVDAVLKTSFRKEFVVRPLDTTALYKYNKCTGKSLKSRFVLTQGKNKIIAKYDPNGKEGTFVFTGQSSQRKEGENTRPSGKVHEFVFIGDGQNKLTLSPKQQEDFKFIYLDHDKNNISKDWEYWKGVIEDGGQVPVFFNKNNNDIKHFGLSYMYKLPYENSVHEMFPLAGYEESLDLANTIFGYTKKENSLKGRVMISHAMAMSNITVLPEVKEILGGPKASYIPYYLEQTDNADVKTYQDNISLKGFKRYPQHSAVVKGIYSTDQKKNENVFSLFRPLDKGVVFSCKIRYHNLRKMELGALLSSISFHQNADHCFHSLGGVKSFGYGNVKVEILNVNNFIEPMQFFEYKMNEHVIQKFKITWLKSKQISELLSMASLPISKDIEETLIYPKIGKEGSGGTAANEFIEIKKNKKYLQSYALINKIDIKGSLITTDVLNKWNEDKERKIKLIQEEASKRQEMRNSLISNAETFLTAEDFDQAIIVFKKAMVIFDDGTLSAFEDKIIQRTKGKIEREAYNSTISSATAAGYENYIAEFPLSKRKSEIEQLLSKLKASSAIPERLTKLTEFEKFYKEGNQWINKLTNKSLVENNFEEEIIQNVIRIATVELSNPKKSMNWTNGNNQKKSEMWFGVEKTNEIFAKLKI
jgi:CRISPR-associated protein (TIGR03986 family)